MLTRSSLMILAVLVGSSSAAVGQTVYTGPGTYQQIGPYTYGPNGSTQQQIGPFNYVNPNTGQPPVNYQTIGPFTYGSNGSSHQQIGNFGYGSDGTTTQRVGDFTYIQTPSGKTVTCQQIGAQTYCD